MLNANLSERQKEYRQFFKNKLEEYGVNSPAELSPEDKTRFFNEIRREWPEETPMANQLIHIAELLALSGKTEVRQVIEEEW